MKKYLLRVACAAALTVLTVGSSVQAQGVFSPSVNGVRSIYQTRRAAATDAGQERAFFVITCSVDASAAAIANQIIGMGGVIRSLMGNQLVVDLPMSKLDEVAAIQGVLLIDIPARGSKKTDSARKASRVDEVHQGKADGLQSLPQAYTGKGVIIGLIDGGFDFTHPMFKDKDGKLRIKGVYAMGYEDAAHKALGESLTNIPCVDDKGVATSLTLTGSFFTNPDVILDTLKVKDVDGSHGTHCASIAAGSFVDYNGTTFKGKDDKSGRLGGMAPDAELMMAFGPSYAEQEKYPSLGNFTAGYADMQAMYAMKHFAEKAGKPLIISWSQNNHAGFHDGTSSTARYVANYCKAGNPIALCSSNEGDEKNQYIGRKISKGKTLQVMVQQTSKNANAQLFIKTDKAIKVDLVLLDANKKEVKRCNLALNSKGTNVYEKKFEAGRVFNEETKQWDYYAPNGTTYYDDLCKEIAQQGYINTGKLTLNVNAGTGLDKNNKAFSYVHIQYMVEKLTWDYTEQIDPATGRKLTKTNYFPVLAISSPDEDVELQAWGDYAGLMADSMENPGKYEGGTDAHSMGDFGTSGEAVSIGAYATDNRDVSLDEETGITTLEKTDIQVVGQYAYFSSYGTDFSDEQRSYPDVSAPGFTLYAAGNSFDAEFVYGKAEYSNQFKGQDKPREYPYSIMSGTSMSTPAAAGIFALWMQAAIENKDNPNCRFPGKLTNANIKDIIKHSSDTDEFTKKEPLRYGAGKINAYKGLIYVLGLDKTAIGELPTKHIGAKLDGRTLIINGNPDVQVSIYNLSGQKVFDAQAVSGTILLPQLPAGVYAVKIGNQGSTLIRL